MLNRLCTRSCEVKQFSQKIVYEQILTMKEFMIRNYYSGQMTKGIFKGLILSLFTMVTALAYGQIPPTAIQDEIFTYDSESASGDLSENDLNPSNSTLTYTILEGTSLGDLTVHSDGTWLFIPDIYISGANDTLIYQVCDQLNQCSQDTIRLYIQFHNKTDKVYWKRSYAGCYHIGSHIYSSTGHQYPAFQPG